MAKAKEQQQELELEDNKKEEVQVSGEASKDVSEDDAQKKIKELQDQIAKHDSDRKAAIERAERLEKEKSDAEAKAKEATGKAALTQKDAINRDLENSTRALEFYRKAYKDALEAGDSDKAVESQEKLAEAVYLNSELKKNKVAYEHWEKQQEEEEKKPKQVKMPPSVQAWIDRNPRYMSDEVFKAEADTAHDAAIRRGYQFGSLAYLEFIDNRIEKVLGSDKSPEGKKQDEEDVEDSPRNFQAPPARGASGSGAGKKTIKLSAAQIEAAEFMGMTPVEYAKYLEAEKGR